MGDKEKDPKLIIKDYLMELVKETAASDPNFFELINMNQFIEDLTKVAISNVKNNGIHIIQKDQFISVYEKSLHDSIKNIISNLEREGLIEFIDGKHQLTEKGKSIKKKLKKVKNNLN